jgi:hypothetical protein
MQGFISYAHMDHAEYQLLRRHLKAVERAFDIDFWADKRIKPGNYWNAKIAKAIEAATVHLLVFSPGFIDSNYIFDDELPQIAKQKRDRGDLVLPLIFKSCIWENTVDVLQAFPNDGTGRVKPVCKWRKEEGYFAASQQIMAAMTDHFAITPKKLVDWGTP